MRGLKTGENPGTDVKLNRINRQDSFLTQTKYPLMPKCNHVVEMPQPKYTTSPRPSALNENKLKC